MAVLLAISPHLDDAVLSAGARLHQAAAEGDQVVVFTVFAGPAAPPYSAEARRLHEVWGLGEDPVASRRAEDGRALARLGATPSYGGFHDSIYRRAADGSWIVGDEPRPDYGEPSAEPGLAAEIAATISALIDRERPDALLTCAAVGGHLDHRHVRAATIAAALGAGVPIELWEDMPYGGWTDRSSPLDGFSMLPAPVVCDDRSWDAKYEAIGCYESQLSMLWHGRRDFRAKVDAMAAERSAGHGLPGRAEMFWRLERVAAAAR